MFEAFRATLSALREQFARAAERHPELYFEEVGVSFEGDDPQKEMWKAFIAANRGDQGKEEWYIAKRSNVCGRFYGDIGAIEEFKRLAESLDLVLRELDEFYDEDDGETDFYRCLGTMLNASILYRTPLLWARSRTWGIEGEAAEGTEDEMVNSE